MSGAAITTLVLVAFILGGTLGSMYQTWTAHYRNLVAMTTRYEAERNWINARTAELVAELEHETTAIKRDFKRKTMEVKHGKKKN